MIQKTECKTNELFMIQVNDQYYIVSCEIKTRVLNTVHYKSCDRSGEIEILKILYSSMIF